MKSLIDKKMKIFIAIAYGIPYLMGILMFYGYQKGFNLGIFPLAQMYYPACGVITGLLLTRKKEQVPRLIFVFYIVATCFIALLSIYSIVNNSQMILQIANLIVVITSILMWVLLIRIYFVKPHLLKAYGLEFKNIKGIVLMGLFFIVLIIIRTVVGYLISGELSTLLKVIKNPLVWINFIALPINFLFVMLAFFGEEYGWREYLQPILQQRFGIKKGVILLGIVWGIWHLPINLFYYNKLQYGFMSVLVQQVTCITLGIFLAYAYMKTKTVWAPVFIHYLNNNLIPIITGNFTPSVLENQIITWQTVVAAFIINGILFGVFLFSKYFKDDKYIPLTIDQKAEQVFNTEEL